MIIHNFIAAKAFIRHKGKILILRESGNYIDGINQGKYDVCGGRIDLQESLLSGLAREIQEETSLTFDVNTAKLFFTNAVTVEKHGETWHITRHFFVCDAPNNQVILSKDHDHSQWIDVSHIHELPIITNLLPAFDAYSKWIKQ